MSEVLEQESTELELLPSPETALEVYQQPKGLDPYIDRIRAEVVGHEPDVSTDKGRKAIASLAFKVRRAKSALDALGKEQVDRLKDIPKKIDAERKRMRDELDALAEEVRRPLDEWQAAEDARIAEHKSNVAWFGQQVDAWAGSDAVTIREAIASVQAVKIGDPWQEFETEALRAKAAALESLTAALADREKYESERAELAELRRKQAEQEQKDREARIAQEAAEKARQEAEAQAQAEREAAARREAQAKAAAEQAERDRLEAIERQRQAEARAEAEKLAAEQRAKDAAEAARLAEIERQQQEQARIEVEQRRREADQQHRLKLMGEAKHALMGMNITEELARAIVLKIARGEVPNVTINF
ncbi:hypothetical protein ACSBPU_13060 [Parapusillimonas sp. JC17]|uniref:hypothetical protein n=1 Tax=Parapusillimonas sp. JC17 TaxID=3445768 RepID=UPI003F9FD1F3